MIEIVSREEVEENGQIYVIETYSNGAVAKYGKEQGEPTPEPVTPLLNSTEQAILDTALNTEYLVCLAELGL